ncbi:MAG: hypothetical protein H6816_07050 [Phycisphaerales bacterium]|nr:hypothetical protein [Phycisphaerales bacterium]
MNLIDSIVNCRDRAVSIPLKRPYCSAVRPAELINQAVVVRCAAGSAFRAEMMFAIASAGKSCCPQHWKRRALR